MYVAGGYTYDDILMLTFRQLSDLVNNIHKGELRFAYDDKGNKLNDISPPNVEVYYQSLKSFLYYLFLFFFFAIFKYAIMRTISLHPSNHTVLQKLTQIICILFHNEILQLFWIVSFARVSL